MLSPEFTEILDRAAFLATRSGASSVTPEFLLIAMLEDSQIISYLCSHGFVPPAEPLELIIGPASQNLNSGSKKPSTVGPDADHQLILKSAFLGATAISSKVVLEPTHLILAFIVSAPEQPRNFLHNHGFSLPRESDEVLAKYRLPGAGSSPG